MLQSNARTRADEDQKGIVLGRMVELNTSLVCLDISRMKLTDDDAAHLAGGVRIYPSLWKARKTTPWQKNKCRTRKKRHTVL